MGSSVSDSERRTDIAERTRRGLEEDLEDLRGSLLEDLEEFERNVRTLSAEPPEWTGLQATQLRAPFELRHGELAETAWIGPRVVAVLAGEVEQFVLGWLPPVGEREGRQFEPGELDALIEEGRELLGLLIDVDERAEEAADQGHVVLDELWETALARLDERRESDIGALHDLVGEGALDTGPDAQKERANLWEEQRKKADDLRPRWEGLHEMLDGGANYTADGLDELRAMMRRACDGLQGAYPAVADRGVTDAIFDGTAGRDYEAPAIEEEEADASDEEIPPTDIPAEEPAEEDEEPAPSDGGEISETQPSDETTAAADSSLESGLRKSGGGEPAVRETAPAKRTPETDESGESGEERPTEPMITSAGELRDEGLADSSPLLESSDPYDPEDVHERETTLSLESSAAATDEAARPPDEESEPEREEPSEGAEAPDVADDSSEIEADDSGEIEADDSGEVESDAAIDVDEAEADAESEDAEAASRAVDGGMIGGVTPDEPEEAAADTSDLPDPIDARCIRIRTEWEPVDLLSVLAALGPPVGFLIGLVAVGLLHLGEVAWAPNPVEQWAWTKPAVAVALVWCVCAPLLLRWYPRWAGWRFQFVHEAEIRDDTTLELDRDGFCIDRISFKWEAIDHHRIRRWEAPDDDLVGWLLVVEPTYHDALTVIAPEHHRSRWEQGDGRVLEPPSDAWQIDAEAFDRMTAFLERLSG